MNSQKSVVETLKVDFGQGSQNSKITLKSSYGQSIEGGGILDTLGGVCEEDNERGIAETVKDDCGHNTEQVLTTCEHNAARYGSQKSTVQVKVIRKGGVPVKTQEQSFWIGSIWHDWARYQRSIPPTEKEEENELKEGFAEISVTAMNFWLCKFVIEVRCKDNSLCARHTLSNLLWVTAVT